MIFFKNKRRGFTLVEMLVAVALFVIIAFISIGAILTIFSANKKSQTSKTVVDNLNYTIENMVRNVRFGSSYHCGTGTPYTSVANCSAGSNFLAVRSNGSTIIYRQNGSVMQYSGNGGTSYQDLTPPDVVITYVRFYVFGTDNTDTVQPYVVAVIRGYVGSRPTTQTVFSLETIMSQRELDL